MRKTEIIMAIQDKLSDIVELKYIDKDWGQLNSAVPAVNFPCCLIDIDNVVYEDGRSMQEARASIVLTIANHRTVPSSATAPDRALSYYLMQLTDEIDSMLHLFTNGNFAPLVRTSWKKLDTGTVEYECYEMRYVTAYKCDYRGTRIKNVTADVDIMFGV